MATQSGAPPNPTNGNMQNPELAQHMNQDQQESRAKAPKQSITPSVFVTSEPMREEQVQNAVKFLSHPKVRGSPVIYRRSFLEKKGLTREEIDEAFRRVPDPQPSAQAGNAHQDGQVKSSSNNQPQAPVQTLQPVVAAPTGAMGTLMRYQFHWSHAIFAIGLLAVSGAGTAVLVKKAIVPRLKSWIRKIVSEEENDLAEKRDSKPSLAEEAAAAAKVAAAADVAKASQEMLQSRNEERRYFEEFTNLLDVQVQEMKSMTTSLRKLEVVIGVDTFFQGSLSVEDEVPSRVLSSLEEANELLLKNENGVTEGSVLPTCSMPPKEVVGSNKMARKGLSRGGAPTSNVLVDGTTTPMWEVKKPLMVTTTMDSNNIAVEEVRDLNVGYCGEEITGLSLVPCEEERLGLGEQLGTMSGDNVVPLVSLPQTNNIAGSPSDWVLQKVKELQHIAELPNGGYEDQFIAILTAMEARAKSRELKRLP